ncbi:hypothetical protein [Rubripirellula amarantea]|uniref:hypothetical protein n=1 Tax=Rubripirellula amarantea TaxID=2527999 RepID=UPI0011B5CC26|nr:hypothetical protein [Rubripirellula amarantea]
MRISRIFPFSVSPIVLGTPLFTEVGDGLPNPSPAINVHLDGNASSGRHEANQIGISATQ